MDRKTLDKIKKCLALGRSSNVHEAAAAMRQAQKLMDAHGVTPGDVAASEVESHIARAGAGKTPPTHIAMLANMVARAFGAELVYRPLPAGNRWIGCVEFYGVNGAGEVAGYAFEVLGRQLNRDRNAYLATLNKRIKRTTKIRRGDLYAQAWVETVAQQVTTHQRTEAEDQIIATYQAMRWSTPLEERQGRDNTKGMRSHDVDALYQGRRDGKKVSFHQGVNGTRQAVIGSQS
ncbi:DUF2786 domain-containing protein [Modicisalibacter sp. MOD 31.J]|uniref:DUF2786 domain-containing protein n=1 Tax=Modicisalibacter sp. MOD 31.J TaxID=2831897 RepID=UPI001CCBDDB8|nr:DUF2786 domain-containing protein [Modicisalibacter sp. MOD 31.J]MBZ9574394.1 DUF2786 domain-containing protein [Modicisalibacter sp. MOD 31.J]